LFHHKKEFFRINIEDAKSIASSTLDTFFQSDNTSQLHWRLQEKATTIKEKLISEPKITDSDLDISELEKEALELLKELNKL
ncbi:MAG: hypothetical protein K8R85_10145, partial [Bacteroidetes bacterium]|nr:hypothetical protein [Bacteroidota bacterium]